MCNVDRSIPSRSAGSTGVSAGANSCRASGRNKCGLRSSSFDSACRLNGQATRSGTRRLGLRMPRGRPRGLPELPLANRPRASRARQSGIRTKWLKFLDTDFWKQDRAGRIR